MIHGIAIHGTDFAGKTTLQQKLCGSLRKQGLSPQTNCGPLTKSVFLSRAIDLIYQNWQGNIHEINRLLLEAYLTDKHAPQGTEFVVQDTYFQRSLAYCHAYHLDDLVHRFEAHKIDFPQFQVNVYLDASYETRLKRMKNRSTNSPLDREMIRDPKKFEQLGFYLQQEIEHTLRYLFIQTDDLSIEEVLIRVEAHMRE